MTSPDARVERVFHAVVELAEEERPGYLERACAGDTDLRRRVERLLAADAHVPGRFLATDGEAVDVPVFSGGTRRIGGFEILERLGEGGMGTVYAALQRSPRREVALKIVRVGRMTPEATARFRREIEVLGNLRHPGIAQIYQAGSTRIEDLAGATREVPWFAMELVRGPSLLDYARSRGLDLRARLELFVLICDAVHHAHLQGVVHRDIKSENVLVTDESTHIGVLRGERRRVGQPKVLDFGIARLVEEEEPTTHGTRVGDVIGTLTNIAPEQLRGDTERIDARADVYSLGVLLYQLLAGRLPIDLCGKGVPEALRALETETPPPLGKLSSALRGDLTVIASKALEHDLERRYAAAADLADDVRRHLAGEPIRARAHSRLYVLTRTLQRHRAFALSTALVMILLLAFALTYRDQAIDNRALAEREAAARRTAESALSASRIERGRLLGRTGNTAGERLLWSEYLGDPDSRAARWALREFYATHPCLASRQLHGDKVRAVALRPEGGVLASVADDGFLRFTDPETLADVRAPIEIAKRAFSMAFRPRTNELVVGTEDGEILVWDVGSGRLVRRWKGHDGTVRCLGVDARGELLATGGDDAVRLWDLRGTLLREVEDAGRVIYRAEFAPDGTRLALACSQGLWVLEDARTSPPRRLAAHTRTVNGVAFGADGDTLYSSGADGRVFEWDLAGEARARLVHEGSRSRGLWGNASAGELVVLYDRHVERIDVRDGSSLQSLPLGDTAWAIALDGERLVVGDRRGWLRWWSSAPPWRVLSGFAETVVAAYSPDGTQLLTADAAGTLRAYGRAPAAAGDARAAWISTEELDAGAPVTWVAVDDRGRWLWSTAPGTLFARGPGAAPTALAEGVLARRAPVFALSPDGTRLAVAGSDRRFRVLALPGGEELRAFPTDGDEAYAVAWSPDGRWLATLARNEEHVVLRSFEDGSRPALERRLSLEGQRPLSCTFTADGSRLILGTWERVIRVWNVEAGRLEAELAGHQGAVWDVRCLDDEPDTLASLGADGTLRIWSLAPPRELATFVLDPTTRRGFLASAAGAPVAVAAGDATLTLFDPETLDRSIAGNRAFARQGFPTGDEERR